MIIQKYYVSLQVSITFADTEAVRHDICTSVTDTDISHGQREASNTSDNGGKVAEKTAAGMLHVTHTYTLYKETTQY